MTGLSESQERAIKCLTPEWQSVSNLADQIEDVSVLLVDHALFSLERRGLAYWRPRRMINSSYEFRLTPEGEALKKKLEEAEDIPLPTIEEMSGLVEDMTGGLPLGEYMKEIRGG